MKHQVNHRHALLPSNWATLAIALSFTLAASLPVHARKLLVGPGKTYAKPSAAAAVAKNGDTVEITPGTYERDVCVWSANNLTLRATSKYARLDSKGMSAREKGIWVITGANTTVENIEFTGAAAIPDSNLAGIRQEGPGLTVRNCYFHHNENGILQDDAGDILIEYSEFAYNGDGDGFTHNIYIGNATSFTLRFCYMHHAIVGHNVKSRAFKSVVAYNRIMSEADGTTSYEVDFPDGGEAYVMGNLIQHGPKSENPVMMTFGEEGLKNPKKALFVINNTLVNERKNGANEPDNADLIFAQKGTTTVKVSNNLVVARGALIKGYSDTAGNVRATLASFVDGAKYDYRLAASSPAVDKGIDLAPVNGNTLTPAFQYLHKAGGEPRKPMGRLDVGAYELGVPTAIPKRGQLEKVKTNTAGRATLFLDNRLWLPGKTDYRDFLGKGATPSNLPY